MSLAIKHVHLSLLLASTLVLPALSAPAPHSAASRARPLGALAQAAPQGDLQVWEQRFFGRTYEKDPLDKRMQRLELMLFGATQDGSIGERLDQIRSAVVSRASVKADKPAAAEALSQLEQKILKHTFSGQQVEQRLARLEEKIFGKASPAMAAPDRIERLKRTLGIGETGPMFAETVPGPGRNFSDNGILIPFGDDIDQSMPGFGGMNGMGGMPGMDGEINRQLSDMFKHLNEQLRRIPSNPNGPNGGPDFNPYSSPGMKAFPFPGPRMQLRQQQKDDKLPPYLDPNSI